jgi:hypothetical protein
VSSRSFGKLTYALVFVQPFDQNRMDHIFRRRGAMDMPIVLLKLIVSSARDKFCILVIIVRAIALCTIKVFFPFVIRYMNTINVI